MKTSYSTDELEVRDGYVYFKEPIQDDSGSTVEILEGGINWELTYSESGEIDYQIYVREEGGDIIFAVYDKEGIYLRLFVEQPR